jgi:hypothetical protein
MALELIPENISELSPEQGRILLQEISDAPIHEQQEILSLLEEWEQAKTREGCHKDFLKFVRAMWPAFIEGDHHHIMAEQFGRVINGKLKRLIINMPPRHTKSEFASYLLPAWFLGLNPDGKVIQTAHTAELSVGFGRKVRNLVGSEDYRKVFKDVKLQADSKAAGRWNTNKGGEYFAIGVGGAVTGKGADLLIIDDPHSEQEGASADPKVFDRVFEWYTSGPRQRLQPGGSIVVVMTRWHQKDLTGQLVKTSVQRGGEESPSLVSVARLLETGRTGITEGRIADLEMVGPVPAGPDFRRRCVGETGMVESVGRENPTEMRVYYPVMGHGLPENTESGLFCLYHMGNFLHGQRRWDEGTEFDSAGCIQGTAGVSRA